MHVHFAELARWSDEGVLAVSPDEVVGVCAAVAAAPSILQPHEWFELVLGDDGLASAADAHGCINTLLGVYNDAVEAYQEGEVPGPSSDEEATIAAWCKGYLAAALRDPVWLDDETGTRLLAPIGALSDPEAMLEGASDRAVATELRAKWKGNLASIVRTIYDFWEEARLEAAEGFQASDSTRGTFRREGPKVGRNTPCPCGSGKKYKRCCALDG